MCLTEQQSSSPAQRFAAFDEDADEDAPMWHSWVDIRKVGGRVRVEQELPGFCGCIDESILAVTSPELCLATVPLAPLVPFSIADGAQQAGGAIVGAASAPLCQPGAAPHKGSKLGRGTTCDWMVERKGVLDTMRCS